MIILRETRKREASNGYEEMTVKQFCDLLGVGSKTPCEAAWGSKDGFMTVSAESPAFCGNGNGVFYISVTGITLYFALKSFVSIQWTSRPGRPTHYRIALHDGTMISLTLN
jgi:hypothetical protein